MDYWIWDALPVRPRLVICEYNQGFGPTAAVTVPYMPDFSRKARDERGVLVYPKGFFGASLAALERLGVRRGYRLIVTSPGSPNAYFLRNDVAPQLPAISAAEGWQPRTKPRAEKTERAAKLYAQIHEAGVVPYFAARGASLIEVE